MEQYAAEQLALFATNNPLYYYEGENKIHIKIECRKILDDANNRRNATSSSNNNSIPRQLIESSLLHIIVRVYSPAEYVLIRLKRLHPLPPYRCWRCLQHRPRQSLPTSYSSPITSPGPAAPGP
mmetsp:Transcript_1227/g.3905  ORF Transcript_1227/g.3905 Transcript_1227/m.3905 type:complete len:124 (-) Transcript_1227:2146-2517(-)|eukprot:scaffold5543_cov119-Isochrysis_galbana.AAC.1